MCVCVCVCRQCVSRWVVSVCTGGARGATSCHITDLELKSRCHTHTHTHTHTPRLVRLEPVAHQTTDRRRDNDGVERSVGWGHPAVHHTCFRYECVCVCVCGDASASGVEGRLPSLFEVCRFLQCKDGESSQRISSETLFRPVRRLTLGLPRSKVVHC